MFVTFEATNEMDKYYWLGANVWEGKNHITCWVLITNLA